jgi:hypothetical protein
MNSRAHGSEEALAELAARILQAEQRAYDAILLDVDNGPGGLTRKGNDWLYARAGLDAVFAALRLSYLAVTDTLAIFQVRSVLQDHHQL